MYIMFFIVTYIIFLLLYISFGILIYFMVSQYNNGISDPSSGMSSNCDIFQYPLVPLLSHGHFADSSRVFQTKGYIFYFKTQLNNKLNSTHSNPVE